MTPEIVAAMLDSGALPLLVRTAVALGVPGELNDKVVGERVAKGVAP